jgi:hypothetical protein
VHHRSGGRLAVVVKAADVRGLRAVAELNADPQNLRRDSIGRSSASAVVVVEHQRVDVVLAGGAHGDDVELEPRRVAGESCDADGDLVGLREDALDRDDTGKRAARGSEPRRRPVTLRLGDCRRWWRLEELAQRERP